MGTRHIVYMGLSDLKPAERNPKDHDLPSLVASMRRYGWTAPAELDERTGRLVAGHGRREACIIMRQNGEPPPGGVFVDDDGEWLVPVLRGWESRNDTEAEAYIIASNRITEAGGWFLRDLTAMLEDVITEDAPLMETLGYTADDLDDMLRKIDPETLGPSEGDEKPSKSGAPDPDPHMDLSDEDESVLGDDTPQPDMTNSGKTYTKTCPECGHEWSD